MPNVAQTKTVWYASANDTDFCPSSTPTLVQALWSNTLLTLVQALWLWPTSPLTSVQALSPDHFSPVVVVQTREPFAQAHWLLSQHTNLAWPTTFPRPNICVCPTKHPLAQHSALEMCRFTPWSKHIDFGESSVPTTFAVVQFVNYPPDKLIHWLQIILSPRLIHWSQILHQSWSTGRKLFDQNWSTGHNSSPRLIHWSQCHHQADPSSGHKFSAKADPQVANSLA